jgi:hypothetical protein
MQLSNQKLEIVTSLKNLNDSQTQKVLTYIRSLSNVQADIKGISKREAMRQISQALTGQLSQPSF